MSMSVHSVEKSPLTLRCRDNPYLSIAIWTTCVVFVWSPAIIHAEDFRIAVQIAVSEALLLLFPVRTFSLTVVRVHAS